MTMTATLATTGMMMRKSHIMISFCNIAEQAEICKKSKRNAPALVRQDRATADRRRSSTNTCPPTILLGNDARRRAAA